VRSPPTRLRSRPIPTSGRPTWPADNSYLAERRFPEAIAAFQKGRSLAPEATINLSGLAAAYAKSGNRPEAVKILAQMIQMSSQQYVAPFDIAVVYDSLGDTGLALDWLEKAAKDQSEMMLFLKIYPPIADLRGNPRFENLVHRVGITLN
jgi:tetratricopeptide (TPR) repeat protein